MKGDKTGEPLYFFHLDSRRRIINGVLSDSLYELRRSAFRGKGGREKERERDATEIDLEFQGNNSFYNSFLRHLVIFFPRREKGIDCIILLRDE